MKLKKWTIFTPVCAYINCDLEFQDDNTGDMDTEMNLSTLETARCFDSYPELYDFMNSLKEENLIGCASAEVQEVCKKIVFGRSYSLRDATIYHECVVYADANLEELPECVYDFIVGQLLDGWGESMSQKIAYSDTLSSQVPYFDSSSGSIEVRDSRGRFTIHLNFWNEEQITYEDIKKECEEEEVLWAPPNPKLHSSYLLNTEDEGFLVSNVYEFKNIQDALDNFSYHKVEVQDYFQEMLESIQENSSDAKFYFIVRHHGMNTHACCKVGIMFPEQHRAKIYYRIGIFSECVSYDFTNNKVVSKKTQQEDGEVVQTLKELPDGLCATKEFWNDLESL